MAINVKELYEKNKIYDDGIDKEFSVEYHDENVELKNIEKFEKSKKEIQKEIKDQRKKKSKFGIFAVKSEKSENMV